MLKGASARPSSSTANRREFRGRANLSGYGSTAPAQPVQYLRFDALANLVVAQARRWVRARIVDDGLRDLACRSAVFGLAKLC